MRGALLCLLLLALPAIARDAAQVREFRKANPCPVTGKTTGPCKAFVKLVDGTDEYVVYRVDHIYPLCAGGADTPENMQWQELGESITKDRLERELCKCRGKK